MEQIYTYTIKLIRYVLNGDIPELPEDIDFEKLFSFGKSHGVENMLYVALRDLGIAVPADIMQKFKTAYEMQIMVEATQALELEAISEAFEKAGIDHVPLKGSVVKYLYPMPDLRKSGDIDILVHDEDMQKVDALMSVCGYDCKDRSSHHALHLVYQKPPFITIEIHRRLLVSNDRANKLFGEVWRYLEYRSDKCNLCVMDDELFYTFIVAHARKHLYNDGGAGIKTILDIYLCRKKGLDETVLMRYLKLAKLEELNRLLSEICDKWFYDKSVSGEADILEKFIFTGGCFGTYENAKLMNVNSGTTRKMQRLLKLAFPGVDFMKQRYVFLYKRKWLLPWAWFLRFINILMHKRGELGEQLERHAGIGGDNTDLRKIMTAISN